MVLSDSVERRDNRRDEFAKRRKGTGSIKEEIRMLADEIYPQVILVALFPPFRITSPHHLFEHLPLLIVHGT